MPTRVERFLQHLDRLSGGITPRFIPITSPRSDPQPITTLIYNDLPEPGGLTAITYGLSLGEHPQWRAGKPELCISVASSDDRWALAVGQLAERLKGNCPFRYGDIVNFGEPISPDSAMTAFLVFAPAVLGPDDYANIDVGDSLPINIAGCYPIHDVEVNHIQQYGLESFWRRDWDPFDTARPPAV